jgi:hypothetical protein
MKKRRNIYKYVEEILINKTLIVVVRNYGAYYTIISHDNNQRLTKSFYDFV